MHLLSARPRLEKAMFDLKKIEDFAHRVIDYVLYCMGLVIERGNRRHNDASHFSNADHVFQVSQVKRCLPQQKQQFLNC